MRRGLPRRGGKGRGRSGYRRFRPHKGSSKGKSRPNKGKSKGRAHIAENYYDDVLAVKGKKGKGHGKGKSKKGKGPPADAAADAAQSTVPDAVSSYQDAQYPTGVVARVIPGRTMG